MSFAFEVLFGRDWIRLMALSINAIPALVDMSATRDRVRAMIISIRLRDAASRASSRGVVGMPSTITTSTESPVHPIVRLFPPVVRHGGIVGCSTGTRTPVPATGGFLIGGFGFIVFVGLISVPSSGGQYIIELEEIEFAEVVVLGQFGYVGVVGGGRQVPVLPEAIIQVGGIAMMPPLFHRTGGLMLMVFVGFISIASSIGQYIRELVVAELEVPGFGQFGYVGVVGGGRQVPVLPAAMTHIGGMMMPPRTNFTFTFTNV